MNYYSSFHAFFSYVLLGLTFALILLMVTIKVFKINNPKHRKELYILTLALPILAFFLFHLLLNLKCSMLLLPMSFQGLFDSLCKIGIITGRYLIPLLLLALLFGIAKNLLGRVYFSRLTRCAISPDKEVLSRVESILRKRCVSWDLPIPKIVFTSRESIVAMVSGVFNPTIIINSYLIDKLTDSELDMLLTHEIVHIKEKDLLMGGVLGYFRELMFFNPATSLIFKNYLLEREMYCDQRAAEVSGGKKAYAKTLLKVWSLLVEGKEEKLIPNASFIHNKSQIEQRITTLITNKAQSNQWESKKFLQVKLLFTITLMLFLKVIC